LISNSSGMVLAFFLGAAFFGMASSIPDLRTGPN
jgi:hypothetical protein